MLEGNLYIIMYIMYQSNLSRIGGWGVDRTTIIFIPVMATIDCFSELLI